MATEMTASWNYAQLPQDFAAARNNVRRQILRGFFGEPATGVYSASLQESIYDAGCLVLDAVPEVKQIEIDTPNLHYLPAKLLDAVGEKFEDDVFIPTSEPSGSINCIVARGAGGRPTTTAPTSGPKLAQVATKPVSLNVVDAQARAAEAIRSAIVTPKANSCPMAVRLDFMTQFPRQINTSLHSVVDISKAFQQNLRHFCNARFFVHSGKSNHYINMTQNQLKPTQHN